MNIKLALKVTIKGMDYNEIVLVRAIKKAIAGWVL